MDVDSFVAHWGLEPDAQKAVLDLPEDLQQRVFRDFAPKPGTRDVTRLFFGWLKSIKNPGARSLGAQGLAGPGPMQPLQPDDSIDAATLQTFVVQWCLDAEAQASLMALPGGLQAQVMAEFNPRPGTRDPSRLFHGFVRSLKDGPGARSPRSGGSYMQPSPMQPSRQFNAPTTTVDHRGQSVTLFDREAMQKFALQWSLNEDAQSALVSLSPEMQALVCAEFNPRPGTQDVNRLFHGFIKSRSNSMRAAAQQGGGMQVTQAQAFQPMPHRSSPGLRGLVPATSARSPPPMDLQQLQAFVDKWSLDEYSCEALQRLDAASQSRVVRDFFPRDQTQDVNRIFQSFARSALASSGPMQQSSMGYPGAGPGAPKRSWNAASAMSGSDPVAAFAERWGLDPDSTAAIYAQPPDVQRQVIQEFNPKPGTRDPSRLLHGFMRSIAMGGGKRPRADYQQPPWEMQQSEGDSVEGVGLVS